VQLGESVRRRRAPAQGRMKPKQLEIARLKREVAKLAHHPCIIAGERDPVALTQLRDTCGHAGLDMIGAALTGHYRL
jgi:hypothetical protein